MTQSSPSGEAEIPRKPATCCEGREARRLLEFDGSQGRLASLPSHQLAGLLGLSASPAVQHSAIGFSSGGSVRALIYLVPLMLLLPIAILGVGIWIFRRFRRRQLHQHQLVTQAVQHATGEIPDELQHGEKQLKWRGRVLIVLLGTGVAFYFVHRVWPQ